jgi:hypothetical protein
MAFFNKPGGPGLFRKEDNTLRQSGPIYLQYGCSQSYPDSWINFDTSPTLRLQRLPVIGGLFKRAKRLKRPLDFMQMTPAMAAGVTSKLWDMSDKAKVLVEWERANA